MNESEFPRPVRLDTIGQAPRTIHLTAEPAEREALARRFDLVTLDRLDVEAAVRREAAAIIAEGRIVADVVQSCVATGQPIATTVDEPFSLRFVPEGEIGTAEEIELSDADCDTLTYAGSAVDLGEAAAETLLLALDPFPRSADAEAALRSAGVLAEEEEALRSAAAAEEAGTNPFAALKGLRDKLGG